MRKRVPPSSFTRPGASYRLLGVINAGASPVTCKARSTAREWSKLASMLALWRQTITQARNNLTMADWFHSLPFQRFQTLLTLFPKSFSPFPHGTCLLSASNIYGALDEIYHPLCAPIPRCVTLRMRAEHRGLQMKDGILTLSDALFQEAYTCASVGNTSPDYNSRPKALIPKPRLSLFIRHY